MLKSISLVIITSLLFSSCAGIDYTVYQIVKPVDVHTQKTKWVIDEPVLNIPDYYSTEIIDTYRETMRKNFGPVKSIREFSNARSVSKFIKNNMNALTFYREQTQYDYLVETEIKSIKNDLPNFQIYPNNDLTDELYIRIMVYDLAAKSLVYDKEYRFENKFEGGNNIAFAKKTEKFYRKAIKSSIKEFSEKYNWNWKS